MSYELVKSKIEAPDTQNRFADMIVASRGLARDKAAEEYQLESFQFKKLLLESSSLVGKDYSPISAMSVFLDVISAGLSFSPVQKHVYVLSRSVKTGRKDANKKDIYEDRLYFTEQANGLIHLARAAKSIEGVTQPTIVYADDKFSNGTDVNGLDWVEYIAGPGESDVIVGAFCHVILHNGKREAVVLKKRDWMRLAEFSKKQNSKWDDNVKKKVPGDANALYYSNGGQIDPGFLATKLVKKALKYRDKKTIVSDVHIEDTDAEVDTVDTAHEDVTGHDTQDTQPQAGQAQIEDKDPF